MLYVRILSVTSIYRYICTYVHMYTDIYIYAHADYMYTYTGLRFRVGSLSEASHLWEVGSSLSGIKRRTVAGHVTNP